MSLDPQIIAADPTLSAFVSANAGSGKTSTLVNRVARRHLDLPQLGGYNSLTLATARCSAT